MVLSMDRWVGKVAIVTGASVGIGAAIAETLVDHGLIVVGIARRIEIIQGRAKQLSDKKGKLHAVKADLSKEEDILAAFKWVSDNLGPVHILVNNAGVMIQGLLTEGKTKDWRKIFDINVLALCIATREAVKIMKANGIKGHIVNINSDLGHIPPCVPGVNLYPPSKWAVTALTETLRQELNHLQSKIKITSLSPGLTATEMTVYNKEHSEEFRKELESAPSLKAGDIADALVYVLSTPEHVQVHELTIKPLGQPH